MSNKKITITVDALGADKAPGVVLDGVEAALQQDSNLNIILCGPKDVVGSFCANHDRCEALYAEEQIEMGEHPAMAIRKKKNSTIVIGCKSVKDKNSDGFYSAGNTGACLAGATLIIGRIKGILRPMLATMLPTAQASKKTLFGDVGANADCKPQYLLQFAIMANSYLKAMCNLKSPKIALLNIGEEDSKGSKFAQETNNLLHANLDSFSGNAEGRDILSGNFDAVITDGFTGNVVLKNMEGTFKTVFKLLKGTMLKSIKTKIGALLLKNDIKSMVKDLDPESIGAALLFGVKGACCVGHGNSSAKAICNGILNTASFARNNVVGTIEKELENINL